MKFAVPPLAAVPSGAISQFSLSSPRHADVVVVTLVEPPVDPPAKKNR
jgi:hypothetical protein